MNPKRSVFLAVVLFSFLTPLFGQESPIPATLRSGIKADQKTIETALAMQRDGWEYIMPAPKSAQAAWGNTDGRTTWYVGYWQNSKTNSTSSSVPKVKNGMYVGDGLGGPSWRRGGSPPAPNKLEWLLSKSGGVAPRN